MRLMQFIPPKIYIYIRHQTSNISSTAVVIPAGSFSHQCYWWNLHKPITLHVLDDFTHVLQIGGVQQENLRTKKQFLQDLVTSFSMFVLLQSGVFSLNRRCVRAVYASFMSWHSSIRLFWYYDSGTVIYIMTVPEEILCPKAKSI